MIERGDAHDPGPMREDVLDQRSESLAVLSVLSIADVRTLVLWIGLLLTEDHPLIDWTKLYFSLIATLLFVAVICRSNIERWGSSVGFRWAQTGQSRPFSTQLLGQAWLRARDDYNCLDLLSGDQYCTLALRWNWKMSQEKDDPFETIFLSEDRWMSLNFTFISLVFVDSSKRAMIRAWQWPSHKVVKMVGLLGLLKVSSWVKRCVQHATVTLSLTLTYSLDFIWAFHRLCCTVYRKRIGLVAS